jgi:hypothetical protein
MMKTLIVNRRNRVTALLLRLYIQIHQPHLLRQADLNDLVEDLRLSKSKAQHLGSRLKQWNLLDTNTRVSYFCNRQKDFMNYFTKDGNLVFCNNAEGLLQKLGFP